MWKTIKLLFITLSIGASGGAIFLAFGLPLPWMLGAMTAATMAALAGAPLAVPKTFRNFMVAALGVLLGSQFTPDTFDNMTIWSTGIAGVIGSVFVMISIGILLLKYLGKYDLVTAYFSATPGGLSEMTLVGELMGGDPRRIALTHGVRVLTAVFLIVFYFRVFENYEPENFSSNAETIVSVLEILILISCAIFGYPLARMLRIPAPQLVGPLTVTASLSLSGIVNANPPNELIWMAQVGLGSAIGARFVGSAIRGLGIPLLLSALLGIIMVLVAALFAYVLGYIAGVPSAMLFLAFAPGGLAEMSIIALSMDAQSAIVSSHHMLRIIILVIIAPILFRWYYNISQAKRIK